MEKLNQLREFMKANFVEWEDIESDQEKKLSQPPVEKPYDNNLEIIDLPEAKEDLVIKSSILDIINSRKSRRKYNDEELTLDELSFLLWSTQGVKKVTTNDASTAVRTVRTVPSAGARHPFETYLIINRVKGLKKGIYRYLALSHKLVLILEDDNIGEKVSEASLKQVFVGSGAVTFIWSCTPYRAEWRYHISAHKDMLLDAGHLCENLYIACEAIGLGTCAIGAYNQEEIDKLIMVDGKDEFAVYLAPVGKYNPFNPAE